MEVMVAPPKGRMISDQYDFRCIFHDPLISVIRYVIIIIALKGIAASACKIEGHRNGRFL